MAMPNSGNMIAGLLAVAMARTQAPVEYFGKDVGIRLVRSGGEVVEELLVRGGDSKFHLVLLTPTHPLLKGPVKAAGPTAIQGLSKGLFDGPPTFAFTNSGIRKTKDGATIELTRSDDQFELKKT